MNHSPGPGAVRRAVVTSAARGIGRSIAERLTKDGFDLVLIDRSPAVAAVADELGAVGAVVDLAAPEAVGRLRNDLPGPTWLLVNNAGVFDKTPILEIDLDE